MPKIALFSDVHANLCALEAVFDKLEKEKPDIWVCLGDIVGYGPNPKECIKLIREKNAFCVLGNHDAGVAGLLSTKHFRNPNRRLIEQTKEILSEEEISWLKGLPLTIENPDWIAAHASPNDPEKWEYIESAFTVREILSKIDQKFCLVGHTHKPVLASEKLGVVKMTEGYKYFINPGSVGQPRDGNYKASCGLLDTESYNYQNFRIEFEVEPVLTNLENLGFSRDEANTLMKSV